MTNILEHFKATVFLEFDFLKNFGFAAFEEVEIAYEYHLIAKSSNDIEIDFHIEIISSSPIWITINGIYLERLFNDHPIFNNHKAALESLYENNFNNYLKASHSEFLKNNQDIFLKQGIVLNENYLKSIKKLLLKNKSFLQDPVIYDRIKEEIQRQNELTAAEDYKDYKNLFNAEGQMVPDEVSFKAKFENYLLIIETEKLSAELLTFDEFKDFLKSLQDNPDKYGNIIYKFEPKQH